MKLIRMFMVVVGLALLAGCGGMPTIEPTDTPVLISECFPTVRAFVWEDLDADGERDEGERPLGQVEVRLFRGTGGTQGTDFSGVTRGSGEADIRAIIAGDDCLEGYFAVLTLPNGYISTTPERVDLTGFDYPNDTLSFGLQPTDS